MRRGADRSLWLRWLVLAGVLVGISELTWRALGATELVIVAGLLLPTLSFCLSVRLKALWTRTVHAADERGPSDLGVGGRGSASHAAEAADKPEHGWEPRRVADRRGR